MLSDTMKLALTEAYEQARQATGGRVADYIPELATADPALLAVAACTVDGTVHALGDADHEFTIQSISKPFVYALALADYGAEAVHRRVGVEPTGDAFNSIIRLEQGTNRPHNPMINAGAIAVASMIQPMGGQSALDRVLELVALAAGRDRVQVDLPVNLSEEDSGHRNRAIAHLMKHFRMLDADVEQTLDLYFRQCSILVSCRDLAVMAATLANHGVNPVTGKRVIPAAVVPSALTVMLTCGLYDSAGEFAFHAGVPAKSGVSGGLIGVSPGVAGLAAFAPPLDERGNSVRGMRAMRHLSSALELHSFGKSANACPMNDLRQLLAKAHADALNDRGGAVATYIPELAEADPELFGLAICTVDGEEFHAGDADTPFTLQAAANPFTYALALQVHGVEALHQRVGFEPSGNPFNAIVLDPDTNRPFNPLSNAGAIATCGLIPGKDATARLNHVLAGLGRFAGEPRMKVDLRVLVAEREAGERNHAIACLLRNFEVVADEEAALDLYLQQCSVVTTTKQLARMGATLAAGGRNPVTKADALDPAYVKHVLALMYTCGLHDGSGQFAFDVGIPAKSGISGGLVAVVPGRLAIAAYSPRVDSKGTSVRGEAAMRALVSTLEAGTFGTL
ncbi:MAG: glutaminase A [Planctomycetes bacterium]|nr:glutaminase A [Planctomycetota bacterium]